MKKLFRAVPHLTIVLGLMTLTFFAIDRVNRGMAFMTSELSKWVFALLAVLAIASAVSLIAHQWREDARTLRAQRAAQEEQAFLASVRAAQEPPAQPEADQAAPSTVAPDGEAQTPPAADNAE